MGKSALPYEGGEARHHLSPCREIYSVVLVFAAHRRARMDAVLFESDERKAVFQFAYVREEQTSRFVEHHGDDVVRASGVELSKVSRFVNEYLDSACHVSTKNGGNFPALGWTFTPAHGAVPPFGERRTVYQILERGARGAQKVLASFWGSRKMLPMWKCCQFQCCQWTMGRARRPAEDLRAWKPATPMKPATPNAGGRWMKRSPRFPYGIVSGSWQRTNRPRPYGRGLFDLFVQIPRSSQNCAGVTTKLAGG